MAVAWYKEQAARKRQNDEAEDKGRYNLLLRVAILVWLVRNAHKAWMWRSGAWIAILLNSKAGGRINLNQGLPTSGPEWENITEPACVYVSPRSKPGEYQEYQFRVESGTANVTWSPLR